MASRWLSRVAVGTAIVGATTIAGASAAWAVDTTNIDLKPEHVGSTAAGFGTKDCSGPFDDLDADQDGWHFILPSSSGDSFVTVNLTFSKPGGGTENVSITSTDSNSPSADADADPGEWIGWIDNAGASDKHAYLIADAGWTLTGGNADVTPDDAEGTFNLSHTCAGTPSTTEPPRTTEPPTTPPTTSKEPELPVTGAGLTAVVVAGLALVGGGTALLIMRRRRDALENPAEL